MLFRSERLPVNVYMAADFIKSAVQAAEDMQGIDSVVFCGDGAEKFGPLIQDEKAVRGKVQVSADAARVQDAICTARAAAEAVSCKYSEAEPKYIQKPEAERKLEARNMVFKKREAEGIFGLGNCDNAGISSEGVTVDIGDFAICNDEEQIFELPPENEVISYRRAVFQDIEAMAALDALCFGRAWSAASYEAELGSNKVITYVLAENEAADQIGRASCRERV